MGVMLGTKAFVAAVLAALAPFLALLLAALLLASPGSLLLMLFGLSVWQDAVVFCS